MLIRGGAEDPFKRIRWSTRCSFDAALLVVLSHHDGTSSGVGDDWTPSAWLLHSPCSPPFSGTLRTQGLSTSAEVSPSSIPGVIAAAIGVFGPVYAIMVLVSPHFKRLAAIRGFAPLSTS